MLQEILVSIVFIKFQLVVGKFEVVGRRTMDLKSRLQKLKAEIPAVFLSLKDNKTPLIAKFFAAITVAYALSPVDLIPDFIPVLGYLDDLILLPAFIALTIRFIPKPVWEKNLALAIDLWKDGKPQKWYYATPIILFWIVVIWLIVKAIWL